METGDRKPYEFLSTKKVIEDGDMVLIWVSRAMIKPVWIKSGETMQTKFGPFKHDDIIGKRYGSQLPSMTGRGFVHVIAPTPELWALSLPHRTQIVYTHDASYIVQRLQVNPGTQVIEAGTGSGAFTHALARTVSKSDSKVWTYEYHKDRYEQAINEFANHGLSDIIHASHRNVCEDGFKLENHNPNATAVFLDLPAPWVAIPRLQEPGILDRSKVVNICCFSPCMEQVVKTVETLQQQGFRSIEMVENQSKRWEGHHGMVRSVDEALSVLRDIKHRRETGLERRKRKRHAEDVPEEKRTPEQIALLKGEFDHPEVYNPWGRSTRVREGMEGYNWKPVSWTETEIKTHTSYLTFAQLPPVSE